MNNYHMWQKKGKFHLIKTFKFRKQVILWQWEGGGGNRRCAEKRPYRDYSSWPSAYGCHLLCGWLRSRPDYVGNMQNISMDEHMLNNSQRAPNVLVVVPT